MHLKSNKQQAFLFLMLTDNIMMTSRQRRFACPKVLISWSSFTQVDLRSFILVIKRYGLCIFFFLYEKERSTDRTIHCWRHFVYFWCILVKYPRQSHLLSIQWYRWINHNKKVFIEPWIGTNGAFPALQHCLESSQRGKKQQLPSVIFRPNAVPMRCQFGANFGFRHFCTWRGRRVASAWIFGETFKR